MTNARLLVLLVVLAGCSPTFYRPGATEAEMARDSYACQTDPAYREMKIMAAAAPGYSAGIQAKRLLVLCMQARGWSVK